MSVTQGVNLPVGQSNASGMLIISIAPQLIWLFGDTIEKVFLAKVDAMDYVPGLPLTERTTRREQLTTQLRTLEEKEEELICEAELAHLPIYRRGAGLRPGRRHGDTRCTDGECQRQRPHIEPGRALERKRLQVCGDGL
ncbi:hypothetical protein DFO48_10371 [Comamonas sp. AG1104]|nr:hypothetical protein DFO48_10371 [Comamonas sp. AG1104]